MRCNFGWCQSVASPRRGLSLYLFETNPRRPLSPRPSWRTRVAKNLMQHRHNKTIRNILWVGTVHDNTESSAPSRFFCKYSGSAKALWRGDNRAAGFRVEPRLVTRSKRYFRGLSGHVMSALPLWVISGHFAMRERCPALPPEADISTSR